VPVPIPAPPLPIRDEVPEFAFNPAYPNVLMLPSPATGDNSSIRTLTLD
jgi:hypothetical protein